MVPLTRRRYDVPVHQVGGWQPQPNSDYQRPETGRWKSPARIFWAVVIGVLVAGLVALVVYAYVSS